MPRPSTTTATTAQEFVDRILSAERCSEFEPLCEEIKQRRWKLKDVWLESSLRPEAQKNGLLRDHFVNFSDLFDAIIAKALLERLQRAEPIEAAAFFPFFALLQLIFTENERVLSFLFLRPVVRDRSTLAVLIDWCPELKRCIPLLMDSIHECVHEEDEEDRQYFALFVSLLAKKYPSQAALELSQFIMNEVGSAEGDEVIRDSLARIKQVFPFLEEEASIQAASDQSRIYYSYCYCSNNKSIALDD